MNIMKKLVILYSIVFIMSICFISSVNIPDDCSKEEIEEVWDSIFEETSSGITIFNGSDVQSGKCDSYFSYKIDGDFVYQILSINNLNITNITAIKINSTQEYIDLINNFNNISDAEETQLSIEDYANLREENLSITSLNDEFGSVFEGSLSGGWEIIEPDFTISDDTMYFFETTSNDSSNSFSETGYITINNSYESFIFIQKPLSCISNWNCTSWSNCIGNETKIRTCTDLNDCDIPTNLPSINISCIECNVNWSCSEWSDCIGDTQIRSCIDYNNCGNDSSRPIEGQSCSSSSCTPIWQCENWVPEKCPKGKIQKRNCTDTNDCDTIIGKPEEEKLCTYKTDIGWLFIPVIAIIILAIIVTILVIIESRKKTIEGVESNDLKKPPKAKAPPGNIQGNNLKRLQGVKKPLGNIQSNLKRPPKINP